MIRVNNLSKSFGPMKALDEVDLNIAPGEMVALIGASGSGKSTLLRHLSGLTTGDRQGGRVVVEDQPIQADGSLASGIRSLRRGIGVVFQQFNLVGRLSVQTNVMLGALGRTPLWRALSMSFKKEDRRLAHEALERVGIGSTARQRASTLSGGQQQRAAIARALVQKARLLLADEPIASLDPESSRRVMEILAGLNREEGLTVVVTLHQVDYAIKYCPRTVALHHGKVVYDGPSRDLTPAMLRTIYGAESEDMFAKPAPAPVFNPFAAQPHLALAS